MAGRYVYISANDAARIASLIEQEERLSVLRRILLSIVNEARGSEIIPDPAEFKRRFCPDSTFLDE